MQTTSRFALALAISAGMCTGFATAATPSLIEQQDAARQFRVDHPNVRIFTQFDRLHKIAAKDIAHGGTALESANKAREAVATMLGVDATEFIPVGPFPDGAHMIQLGDLPDTDDFKFSSVYWTQTADGLPVWRTRLNVLVRNVPDYPSVYVTSDVRNVAGFKAPADLRPNQSLARAAATRQVGIGARLGEIEVVCFAGIEDMRFAPRPAMVFEAEIGSKLNDSFEKYLLVVDLETGGLLHEENRIIHSVSGNVQALATTGSGADECEDEIPTAMPYVQVTGGGDSTYTDAMGSFTLDTTGVVTASAGVSGQWFNVNNAAGGETSDSDTVPDGGFVQLILNETNSNEAVRAQVNGYVQSNVVRDFILDLSPTFPTIGSQTGFPVNVMVSGSCNAFYDYSSINFYPLAGGCNNTAFSVIVHHEYGHHAVNVAGSGQGAYGEGMGDVLGVLITGDPKLARGFYQGDCVDGIRNADNDFLYPCSGAIHYCGQLISGCAWDVVLYMEETYSDGHEIASRLFVDSMTLHSGTSIDPSITMDILVLDDDDGDLDNGTPHSVEILAGMAVHNMDELPEPLGNDYCSDAYVVADGSTAFSTVGALSGGEPYNDAQCSGTYLGEMASDVWFSYDACESGSMTVSTCDSVTFDTDLVVYSGTCDSLTQVSCNGDGSGCGGYSSILTFDAVAGTTYLIRVGGWDSSASGSGNLLIDGPGSGPPCSTPVTWGLPDGVPDIVDPNGTTSVNVQIIGGEVEPDPETAMLHYSNNGDGWMSVALEHLGGDAYLGTFPSMECGSVAWYLSVAADGDTYTHPSTGEAGAYVALVLSDLEVAFEDDFQTDMGWTTIDGATEGNWDRATPVGNGGDRCDNPTDGDGSGVCYVTGNANNEDVDGGTATLVSPNIACSSGSTLSYLRWYNNGQPCDGSDSQNDIMEVDISYDGGSSWSNLETVGPTGAEASGGWYNPNFVLSDVPNDTITLRVVVGDLNAGSVIEAAFDGVLVSRPICDEVPDCPGDFNGDGTIDVNDILHLIGAWGGPDGDLDGNGTTDVDDLLTLIALFGTDC